MNSSVEYKGCNLAYKIVGSGPTVVFIQGVGVHGDGWRPQVLELSKEYTCLTFDNRGIGKSLPVGGKLTFLQMVDDAHFLLNHCKIASAHLIGHSLGGLLAIALALKEPSRVSSLSLLCTFSDGRTPTTLSWRMIKLGLRTLIGTKRMRRHAFLEMVLGPEFLRGRNRDHLATELEPLFGHDLAVQPQIAREQLIAMRRYDATHELMKLSVIPTIVMSGTFDPISRGNTGAILSERIPGSRFVEFTEASHGLPIQCAAEVNALLLERIKSSESIKV